MYVITVDLDDTLMDCHHDYQTAKQELGEYLKSEYGIPQEDVLEVFHEIEQKNVEEHGLSKERFPTSFIETVEHFVQDVSETEREHVEEIANDVFKSVEEYRERGFRNGVEEFLQEAEERADELHLITAGDERVQNRKIEALNLHNHFDEIHIVEMHGKDDRLKTIRDSTEKPVERIYHIGNSRVSDVEAALRAGVNAIYLPDGEWQSKSTDTPDYDNHVSVNTFDSINHFVEEIEEVIPFLHPHIEENEEE